MSHPLPRRRFLQTATTLGLGAGLGPWDALGAITPPANEAKVGPELVRFRPEIEPVVRWIEETPRDRIFEKAVAELRDGLSYRALLAGLFLAGIRNIKPRPVGFKFHAVMVINSAHLLGQTAAFSERLLPLFWALDNFKGSQAQDVREGDWALGRVDESRVPPPHRARAEYTRAMEAWDADAADTAVTGLCRSCGAAEAMEPIWRMAVRDQRNIGHKPIFAAQSWRTLQAIGWEHAEPVLRSLSFGLLDLQGDRPRPLGPYDANLENARKIREDWQAGRLDPAATRSMLQTIRQAAPEAASAEAARMLNEGIAPESLWDAVVLSASEMMMNSPGIVSLHATTASNSLHYIFKASGDDLTRRLALLQAVGWQPLYRDRNKSARPIEIDRQEGAGSTATGDEVIGEIFAAIQTDRRQAAERTIAFLSHGGSADRFFDAARRMIFHKGTDSHDYKYGAAIWEETMAVADTRWHAPLAAASVFHLPGTQTKDSPLMIRAGGGRQDDGVAQARRCAKAGASAAPGSIPRHRGRCSRASPPEAAEHLWKTEVRADPGDGQQGRLKCIRAVHSHVRGDRAAPESRSQQHSERGRPGHDEQNTRDQLTCTNEMELLVQTDLSEHLKNLWRWSADQLAHAGHDQETTDQNMNHQSGDSEPVPGTAHATVSFSSIR